MDVARSLLGATVWTVILAALLRRFRWSYAPVRAAGVASFLVFVVASWADEMRVYDVMGPFYLEGVTVTHAAMGGIVAFLLYEWRDRTGRDMYKPLSDRTLRWLKRGVIGALAFAVLVAVLAAYAEQRRHREEQARGPVEEGAADRLFEEARRNASDRAVDSVLGGDR